MTIENNAAPSGLTEEKIAHIAAAHTNSVIEFDHMLKFARALLAAAPKAAVPDMATLVNRFLMWPLPERHVSDSCVSIPDYQFPRSGTNLLDAHEAEAMLRHVLAPKAAEQAGQKELWESWHRGVKEAFDFANMVSANRQGDTAEQALKRLIDGLARLANGGELPAVPELPRASDAAAPTLQQISDYLHGLDALQREVIEREARALPPSSDHFAHDRKLAARIDSALDAAYAKQSGNRRTNENDFGAGWEYAVEWMQPRAAAPQATKGDEGAQMIQGRFVLEADPEFPDLPAHSVWSEIATKEGAESLKAKYGDKIEIRELFARAAAPQAEQRMSDAAVSAIMEQAQVFASAWSLVGGPFDYGDALETAEQEKAYLRTMLAAQGGAEGNRTP